MIVTRSFFVTRPSVSDVITGEGFERSSTLMKSSLLVTAAARTLSISPACASAVDVQETGNPLRAPFLVRVRAVTSERA